LHSLAESFKSGWKNFHSLWNDILNPNSFTLLKTIGKEKDYSLLNHENWARIVYDFAAAFHHCERHHAKLISTLLPLYNLRVASLYESSVKMQNNDFENLVEEAALTFERNKSYLLERWEK